MSYSICFHSYHFIAQKALVRMEALIRQLVFEHGFRMRVVKAAEETKDAVNGTPEMNSNSKQEGPGNLKDGDNLIGKINNLVTTDLDNIVEARDFLLLGNTHFHLWIYFEFLSFYLVLLAPLEILISLVFLYQVLGWRYVLFLRFSTLSDI